jgi:hypothetical protein
MKKTKESEIYPSKIMNPICEQAGCSNNEASKHAWLWEKQRWHWHPSPSFRGWWEPNNVDSISGAHVGGHPDAKRFWARKDPGRWVRRIYGIPTEKAWNSANYVLEFTAWQQAGSPEPETSFVSIAATWERQKRFWSELRPIIKQIGKPMPFVPKTPIIYQK